MSDERSLAVNSPCQVTFSVAFVLSKEEKKKADSSSVLWFVFMKKCRTRWSKNPIYSAWAPPDQKKSNLTYNSHIASLVQLVCSCGPAAMFSIPATCTPRLFSRLPYSNHLARCLDSNRWIVAPGEGRGWYICSHAASFYQLRSRVTEQCRGWCFSSARPPPRPPAACPSLSALAVSTPPYTQSRDAAWQADWLIFPSQVGIITTVGLAVQRWRLAHSGGSCLACFRLDCGYLSRPERQSCCF